ncbi:MAG: hypothetical protein MUE85_23245 [Microscillaceae bacterium]|jgi:hypothetical protein|nr:hypothetical protein [Microscillaceae bacterium]
MLKNYDQKTGQITAWGCLSRMLPLLLLAGGLVYGMIYILRLWHAGSEPSYIYYGSSFNAFARNLYKLDFVFTEQGEIAWVYSYYYGGGKGSRYHQYQIDLINPQTRQLMQRVPLDQTTSTSATSDVFEFTLVNQQFFILNQLMGVQWRNATNGALVGDEQTLIQKFPILKAGIGQVDNDNNGWYPMTTKDGLKFQYSPQYNRLLTEEDRQIMYQKFRETPLDPRDKNVVLQYAWGLDGDLRRELYLVKEYKLISETINPRNLKDFSEQIRRAAESQKNEEDYRKREQEYYQKGHPDLWEKRLENLKNEFAERKAKQEQYQQKEQQLLNHIQGKIFLKGEVIYGDSSLCVVMHRSEISDKVGYSLTCVEKTGKIRWELTNPPIKILKPQAYDMSKYQLITRRKGEKLALVSNAPQNIGLVMFDLSSGKVLYEYSPVR